MNKIALFSCLSLLITSIALSKNPSEDNSQDIIDISAARIYSEFKSNEVAATLKYKGKTIRVTGVIKSIGIDILGNPYVGLDTDHLLESVTCYFTKNDSNEIAKLSRGQTIVIIGTSNGFVLLNVILNNCKIEYVF